MIESAAVSNSKPFRKKTVSDIDVTGKRVLLRVDFNVPVDANGNITDDSRIKASLKTINYLRERNCRIILCSHLGRPEGKTDPQFSLHNMARRLEELLGVKVPLVCDCIGEDAEKAVASMCAGDIILLENLRFYIGEEKNDEEFCRSLAKLADIYVNDAFGVSHRAHASIMGIARFLPAAAGFLVREELDYLGSLLNQPALPFVTVMGGKKVSDKMGVILNIVDRVNSILIGGGMAANFLFAQGFSVGSSPIEKDRIEETGSIIKEVKSAGVNLLLPCDVVAADKLDASADYRIVPVNQIPDNWFIADIGPETARIYAEELKKARTVFWNGPLGIFEINPFSNGTRTIIQAIIENGSTTVVGGGSTVETIQSVGVFDRITHVSTGGGASLEFLEGKELPGVVSLMDA
jgi:phosphoglycerate kinase